MLAALRAATEEMERADNVNQMARAVADRASAIDRVATAIDGRQLDFSPADLEQLRDLCGRGAAVLTAWKQTRRDDCAAAAKIDGMRHVMNAFVPAT